MSVKLILRTAVLVGTAIFSFACSETSSPVRTDEASPEQPATIVSSSEDTVGRYILMFHQHEIDVNGAANAVAKTAGARITAVLPNLKGVLLRNVNPAAAARLATHPKVRLIVADAIGRKAVDIGLNVNDYGTWGLDRLDARDNAFTGNGTLSMPGDGAGAHIYILDTGINSNFQFETSRVGNGTTFINWYPYSKDPYLDADGHGTDVATVAAGTSWGVARQATIHSVRISGDGGAWGGDVVQGLDWIRGNRSLPAIANLSFGGFGTAGAAVADAMELLAGAGVVVVKAAGNETMDVCGRAENRRYHSTMDQRYSNPWDGRLVVGALNRNGQIELGYGWCLDLFAPGNTVGTVGRTGAYHTVSGTSIAAPFVSGAAAILSSLNPTAASSDINYALLNTATAGQLSNVPVGSPNKQVFVGHGPSSTTISGPHLVYTDFNSWPTFRVAAIGPGTWSYQWQQSRDGVMWTNVATGSAYSFTYEPDVQDSFVLRALAQSTTGESVTTANFGVDLRPQVCDEYGCY